MYLKKFRLFAVIALLVLSSHVAAASAPTFYTCYSGCAHLQNLTHFTAASCAVAASAVVGYFGHALYLDRAINTKETFWHWATDHIQEGFVDQLELLTFVQEKYPTHYATHPLTAIFAMAHDLGKEITSCLALRTKIQTFRTLRLSGLLSESVITLDKKIESLYLLKVALNNCAAETRKRCRKLALS